MLAVRALACVGLMWTCLAAAVPIAGPIAGPIARSGSHDVADAFVTGEQATVGFFDGWDSPAVDPRRPVTEDLPFTGAPLEALAVAASGLALTGVLLAVGARRRRRAGVRRLT
ncbi:hypothetical protein GT755_08705 [Herbidospora sp. NEAU-GS84]|uniref:LPXTG cell wall anchor domain-containing protein n=1 Tax=Herbidospora solisilvae TaxID=2696284 RepID=A0A7C9JAU0_9ACTN|nr:hypothetical protein [Herbidospora solisilvae]NAS21764.1 hypothetical protein [Herbidospora solisilvae]